jgi:hypothetical protein
LRYQNNERRGLFTSWLDSDLGRRSIPASIGKGP